MTIHLVNRVEQIVNQYIGKPGLSRDGADQFGILGRERMINHLRGQGRGFRQKRNRNFARARTEGAEEKLRCDLFYRH